MHSKEEEELYKKMPLHSDDKYIRKKRIYMYTQTNTLKEFSKKLFTYTMYIHTHVHSYIHTHIHTPERGSK